MRRISLLCVALAHLLALTSCGSPDRPLQFNLGIESVQLDWNRAIDSTSIVLLDNVMEGLTTYADSLQATDLVRPQPALASSWSISGEGRVYRFNLKRGVKWTDGVELEAKHFVDSWRRLLDPATHSPNAYHLFDIENARAFNEGSEKDFNRVGVTAIDSFTLEVRLRRRTPYFLHLVASASTFPFRLDLLEKYGAQWADPDYLVTLGPYHISEWVQGDRIVLQANPGYAGSPPAISRVICRLVPEPLTAFAFYENGRLDVLPRDLPPTFAKQLRSSAEYRSGPKLQVSYLIFNTRRPPFHRVENRRAFIRALNREQLVSLFRGTQAATSGWIPPGLLGYQENLGVTAEGKESDLLAGQSIDVLYGLSDTWNLVFQSVQRQLEEKLRLHSKLMPIEAAKYGEFISQLTAAPRNRGEPMPHLLHLGWVADFPDSHSFMNVFTSSSESNYARWSNREYDRLVDSAVSTADESLRAELYLRAQRILLEEEAAVMPLFITSHQAIVRPDVKGVQLNVLDKWYFRNLSFEAEGWRGLGRSLLRRLRSTG